MAVEITRLTLYAVLTAIEEDLSATIYNHVLNCKEDHYVFLGNVFKKLSERQTVDKIKNDTDEHLLSYSDFGDKIDILNREIDLFPKLWRKPLKQVLKSLHAIIPIRNRVMHSRPLMFNDHPSVMSVASQLTKINIPLWRKTCEVIERISSDNSFLLKLNTRNFSSDTNVLHNLPSADFDETGFIGRDKTLSTLKDALFGAYPVITITGEGGLGKTALAIKACYDLLDDDTNPFDAIIWATAKAQRLTTSEILNIENAITSSLGIFEDARKLLDSDSSGDPLEKLVAQLQAFPTLLVIDNLETVLDDNVRELVRRVPAGSKILFTSRTSIGAFDFPIPLQPFTIKESTILLRHMAKFWSLKFLANSKNSVLESYCRKLQNNPLFIKWFVQAVAAGRSPENVLSMRKMILKYCLSSVLENISTSAQKILETIVLLTVNMNESAIVYYTGLSVSDTQRSLNELLASNLVRISQSKANSNEPNYVPSEMAKYYVQNYSEFKLADENKLALKRSQLSSERERIKGNQVDPYNFESISVFEDSYLMTAKILREATLLNGKGDYNSALKKCATALELSPNYFECHRVQATTFERLGQPLRALASFQTAVSLEPKHAPLRLWFGDFLLMRMDDLEAAREQYNIAEAVDESIPVLLAITRLHFILRDFPESDRYLNRASKIGEAGTTPRNARRIVDSRCQFYQRKLEYLIDGDDFANALKVMSKFKQYFEGTQASLIDNNTIRKIKKMEQPLSRISKFYETNSPEKAFVSKFMEWFKEKCTTPSMLPLHSNSFELGQNRTGKIYSIVQKKFGFIETSGTRLFFSRGSWNDPSSFSDSLVGIDVRYEVGENPKGLCAVNVRRL